MQRKIQSMEEFLDESCIRDEFTRKIALCLDMKRRHNRSVYARTITLMAGQLTHPQPELSETLICIASNQLNQPGLKISLSELANSDFNKFQASWKDAVRLMKGLWGTSH